MSTFDTSKFNEALARYVVETKKNVVDVINTKAYFIARKALWFTQKADSSAVKGELGRIVTRTVQTSSGRTVRRKGLELAAGRSGAPLAALIINSRRKKKGQYAIWGKQMDAAVRDLINSRLRSIAFLKSGWLPAIRFLGGFVPSKRGAAPMDNVAKIYGTEKGSAQAATEANQVVARIINEANAKHDVKDSLGKFGGRALDTAFHDEAGSTIEYLDEKLKAATAKANAELA